MKLRSLYFLSIVGLLLVVLVQIGGMLYAYNNYKKDAQRTLNECFRQAFIEVVDNQINNLPYPDGTIPFYSYTPRETNLPYDIYAFRGYQQASSFLQDVHNRTISPDELAKVLQKKLKWQNIDRTVWIQEAEDHSKYSSYKRFKTVISEKAWVNEPKGEAVEAVILLPPVGDIIFLFLPTLLLTAFLIYCWAQQMKFMTVQQFSIEEQRTSFYGLTLKMKLPMDDIRQWISLNRWKEVEESGRLILEMTEQTLSVAKEEERKRQTRKQYSYKLFFAVSLFVSCLLMGAWFTYLYHTASKETVYQVNDSFEGAFYDEVFNNRYPSFISQMDEMPPDTLKRTRTPFAEKQVSFLKGKEKDYYIGSFVVIHKYNEIDLNYRLRSALILQGEINERSSIVPSVQYLDSAFSSRLRVQGIDVRSASRQLHNLRHKEAGNLFGKHDIVTRFIPLKKDSTLCVQGVVENPYRHTISSIWYLLVPLFLIFLVMLNCIFGQIKVLRIQRRLEQFQKDFTYAMIHDMKSPLTSVLMGANILAGGKLNDKPEKEEKYRQTITDEIEHLHTLSNRVVMLSQIDSGELKLNCEQVVLQPLMKDITDKFLMRTTKKVHFRIDCEASSTIYADMFCLREVLSNLIDNAVKYSHDEVEITLSCQNAGHFTVIKVRDNGIGIPLKEQHKIFEKFERVSSANYPSGVSGFGLGLNYVLQVVEAHGGTVTVESREGVYSEFSISFPFA